MKMKHITLYRFVLFSVALFFSAVSIAKSNTPLSYTILPEKIIQSDRDYRQYQVIELANKMKVLLISDDNANKSITSLALPVGSLYDPLSQQGLAHYAEHMIFMGSKNYPEPGNLQQFLSQHAGSFNASTAQYQTNYFFEVENSAFAKALDRLADGLAFPLFNPVYADKERNAVNAELTMARSNDGFRIGQVDSETVNQSHPYSQFSGGNLETLSDKADSNLHQELNAFYQRYYSANLMVAVLYSNQSLTELAELAANSFGRIENHNIVLKPITEKALSSNELGKMIYMEPAQPKKLLYVQFPIDNNLAQFIEKSDTYIRYILNSRAEGTLFDQLQKQGLIDGLSTGSDPIRYGNSGIFSIMMSLTDQGLAEKDQVIAAIFSYLNLIEKQGIASQYYDEMKDVLRLDFEYPNIQWDMSYVSSLTSQMLFYPITHILDADYLAEKFNQTAIANYLHSFTPDNARIWIIAPNQPTDKVAYFIDAPYSIKTITDQQKASWLQLEQQEQFKLPALNSYIPTDFSIVDAKQNQNSPLVPFSEQGNQFHFASRYFADEPKAIILLSLRNNSALNTDKRQVMFYLLNYLADLDLEQIQSQANISGIALSTSIDDGLLIAVNGFSQYLGDMLIAALATYHNVQIDNQALALAKSWYLELLDAAEHENSLSLAMHPVSALSTLPYFERDQRRQILNSITVEDLKAYREQILFTSVPYMISLGNLSTKQVNDLYSEIKGTLAPKQEYRLRPQIKIENQQTALITQQANSTDNALFMGFYPPQQDEITDQVTSSLLAQIIAPWFYDMLRTEEQLGYAVSTFPTSITSSYGVGFLIQSNQYDPRYLQKRYQAFYPIALARLQALTEDEFLQYKQSMLNDIQLPPQTLDDEFDELMGDFYRSQFTFDLRKRMVAKLEGLTHKDLIDFYQRAITSPQGLVFGSQVLGQQPSNDIKPVEGLTPYSDASVLQQTLLNTDSTTVN